MKNIIPAIALIIVALGIIAGGYYAQSRMIGAAETNIIRTCTHSSSSVAASGSTVVLATSSGARRYARISNDDPSAEVYLSVGAAPSRGKGIHLEVNEEFVLDLDTLAYPAIYAIASATPANLSVIDCK